MSGHVCVRFTFKADRVLLPCVKHTHAFSSAADRSSKQLRSQPSTPGEKFAIEITTVMVTKAARSLSNKLMIPLSQGAEF